MNSLIFFALLAIAIPALGAGIQFPSGASCKSPDGKWMLVCKGRVNDEAEPRLLLLNRVRGRSVELRRIGRYCDTMWSPDSARIALTDRWASDRSDIFVYAVADRVSTKSVRELFPTNAIPGEELAGHCYFEACEWLDRRRLRFKVFGHTDEFPVRSFDHEYILEVTSGRLEKATKKKPTLRMSHRPRLRALGKTSCSAAACSWFADKRALEQTLSSLIATSWSHRMSKTGRFSMFSREMTSVFGLYGVFLWVSAVLARTTWRKSDPFGSLVYLEGVKVSSAGVTGPRSGSASSTV